MAKVGIYQKYNGKTYKTVEEEKVLCKGCCFDGRGCNSPVEIDDATDNECDGIIWIEESK